MKLPSFLDLEARHGREELLTRVLTFGDVEVGPGHISLNSMRLKAPSKHSILLNDVMWWCKNLHLEKPMPNALAAYMVDLYDKGHLFSQLWHVAGYYPAGPCADEPLVELYKTQTYRRGERVFLWGENADRFHMHDDRIPTSLNVSTGTAAMLMCTASILFHFQICEQCRNAMQAREVMVSLDNEGEPTITPGLVDASKMIQNGGVKIPGPKRFLSIHTKQTAPSGYAHVIPRNPKKP